MQLSDVALLTSDAGRSLLRAMPRYEEHDALRLGEQLRVQGHSPELVAAALSQARLRENVRARWGTAGSDLVPQLLLTPDGAEQATRPSVARLRAERYCALGDNSSVADLGCGVGLDALAMAEAGMRVSAYDSDALTVAVAGANAAATGHGDRVTVTHADVTEIGTAQLSRWDTAFADPARRRTGRRLMHPESWSPPLSWVLSLPVADLGVKVAPGLDHDLVPEGAEFAVVSDGGDVVEAALYRGALREHGITRSATLLPSGARLTNTDLPVEPPPVAPVEGYLHEPDGAVIRAGLVAALADQVGGSLIDHRIAYVSTTDLVRSPFMTSYEVFEVMPFSLKRLRAHLRENDVGQVVVKKRGSAIDVDVLRRSLRLDRAAPGRRTILLTRVGDDPLAVVGQLLPPSAPGTRRD